MRYFDNDLITNSRPHAAWWDEVSGIRNHWYSADPVANAQTVLPPDFWFDLDEQTVRIMRDDGGEEFMSDLMGLARPVNIGKMVSIARTSSDMSDKVVRSISGQVPVPVDKVDYGFDGAPITIFSKGYGRSWREVMKFQSEGYDALADDNEAALDKIDRNMVDYALDGDASINIEGFGAYGIRTAPNSKAINLGTGAGGASIDLTSSSTTADQIDTFFSGPFGAMLDANFISAPVNLYISPEIARNWDRTYSGSAGTKPGRIRDYMESYRRINKIVVTHKLSGNEFFGFVPSARFIRPLIGMAVNTTPRVRLNPTDDHQFLCMGAMGIQVRGDGNGRSGVFFSEVVN